MCAPSVPVASIVKLKWFSASLLAVTVNAAPSPVGVSAAGETLQVRGTAPEQRRLTGLAYPPEAVSVPLKIAVSFGLTVSDRLLTASPKAELVLLGGLT